MTFFEIYDSALVCDMHNFEWLHATIIQSGCATVLKEDNDQSKKLLSIHNNLPHINNVVQILGGIGGKMIVECLFDFANMTNPTGGIIVAYGFKT